MPLKSDSTGISGTDKVVKTPTVVTPKEQVKSPSNEDLKKMARFKIDMALNISSLTGEISMDSYKTLKENKEYLTQEDKMKISNMKIMADFLGKQKEELLK